MRPCGQPGGGGSGLTGLSWPQLLFGVSFFFFFGGGWCLILREQEGAEEFQAVE